MHAQRKTRTGTVISNAMQNTAVVAVQRRVQHPKYRKFLTRRARYKVHDERNECGVGDRVMITEARPLSRDKRWRLSKIVRRSAKLAAHDENNDAHVGDTVRVMETRPLSKTKRWRVVEIVERAVKL